MKKTAFYLFLACYILCGCSKSDSENEDVNDDPIIANLYFPPSESADWETLSMQDLDWETNAEQDLYDFLDGVDTKAFIILKDGKMVLEWYFDDHTQNTSWYWASAGKTLTSFMVGIAQEDGFLSISNKTSDYLGEGWTSATLERENKITIKNQLTMTSGLNDTEFDCVTSDCLEYIADADTRWAYHNGPYTLLQSVVANATGSEWKDYFNENLRDKIGMDGFWFSTNDQNNVYFSTARSMARFGLLNLNGGEWNGETILGDASYISQMKNTSQNLNKSYGYLWWLNGKDSHRLPAFQIEYSGELIPNAPADMYCGLGKNDQKLYIVPSLGLVVVRMGNDAGGDTFASSSFDNQIWEKLENLIQF